MAGKKGNGHDPATAAIVEVLERIEKEARASTTRLERLEQRVEEGLGGLREELGGLREELHGFREETREELVDVRGEVHQLSELLKGSVEARLAKIEAVEPRVAKIEAAVFRPTGT